MSEEQPSRVVWVITTHTGHGENAGVMGVYATFDGARAALEAQPNMRVYVVGDPGEPDDPRLERDGTLVGDPADEHKYPYVWAAVKAMKVHG